MTLTKGFIRDAQTTPLDARLMDMSKVVCNNNGWPRTGVLGNPAAAILSALATMAVRIEAAEFVTSRGKGDGVVILTNNGPVDVAIAAAPVSNSRIDVIYVKHNDNTQGDANATPIFGVVTGAAAASPTKPAIPTGAEELGTLRVYAGTTAANGGLNTLTETFKMTAMRGGTVPFRDKTELDAWTNPTPRQQAMTLDDGQRFVRNGSAWGGSSAIGTTFRKTNAYVWGSASSTVIQWNGADFQSDDFDHSSGTFTFKRPGIYLVAFCITCGVGAAVGQIAATLRKNGNNVGQVVGLRSNVAGQSASLSGVVAVPFAVGETMTLDAVSSGANTNADVSSGRNFISITPVR